MSQVLPILIRRAVPRDLGAIVRIEKASFRTAAWPASLLSDYLGSRANLFFVAKVQGRIAGYSIARPSRNGAELDSIAVHPRDQGRGVARSLLRRTLAILRRRGVRACFLTVRPRNRAAIALYRHFGFVRTRRISHYYENGEDGWRMRKRLV